MTSSKGKKDEYPSYLQPRFIPIIDISQSDKPVDYFIENSHYQGQPFMGGIPLAIHAHNFEAKYQKRDGSLIQIPHLGIDEALRDATSIFRRFVLVGTIAWSDAQYRPHNDEISADLANQALGEFNRDIKPIFHIYECLYLDKDLTRAHHTRRVMAAEEIGDWLKFHGGMSFFRLVQASATIQGKTELAQNVNRVLWIKWSAHWSTNNENYVFTDQNHKYQLHSEIGRA